jgi:hypothetical protein
MEPAQTAITEGASSNENFLTYENMKPQDNKICPNAKNIQVDQFFYVHDPNSNNLDISPIYLYPSSYCCKIFGLITIIIIFAIPASIFIPTLVIKRIDPIYIALLAINIFSAIIFIFIYLKNFTKRYIISKDENKKRLYIQSLNCCGKKIIMLDLDLETYHFQCTENTDLENNCSPAHKVILYNDLKNKNDYNLDTSNIKEIPLILKYSFEISLQYGAHKELEFRLNNFINSKSSNNPFDTFKFMYIPKNRKIGHFISRSSICVKYSDNFLLFFSI